MNGFEVKSDGVMNASMVNDRLAAVYRTMALGMAAAAAVAYWATQVPALMALAKSPFMIAVFIAQLAAVIFIGKAMDKWGATAGQLAFYGIAGSMGLIMAPLIQSYTSGSVAQAFGLTCLVLGIAAAYGYSTKKSLASMGAFMFVGLIGVIIASIVNIFLGSPVMQTVLDIAVVVIFTGMAAWDSQRVRDELLRATAAEADKIVVLGALNMWLNFVNMFTAILRLTGEKE